MHGKDGAIWQCSMVHKDEHGNTIDVRNSVSPKWAAQFALRDDGSHRIAVNTDAPELSVESIANQLCQGLQVKVWRAEENQSHRDQGREIVSITPTLTSNARTLLCKGRGG